MFLPSLGKLLLQIQSQRFYKYRISIFHMWMGKPDTVSVTFCHYKHNSTLSLYTVSFGHGPTTTCAVQSVADYIKFRRKFRGPLFYLENKNPVNRFIFDRHLQSSSFCHLASSTYKGHSFRIGTTFAAESNLSDARIRALGRWSSNVFRKYVRISGTQRTDHSCAKMAHWIDNSLISSRAWWHSFINALVSFPL